MPELIPRPYQAQAIAAVKLALKSKKNALLVGPCASGKTAMFSMIVQWLRKYDRTCLILLDREVLAAQTALRLREYLGEIPGIACASLKSKNLREPITVASRQTMAPMLKNGHKGVSYNIVIIDECHLASSKRGQYIDIINRLRENYPETRILGCTATPYRLAGGPIYGQKNSLFDCVDYRIGAADLLDAGYICPLTWKIRQSDLLAELDKVEKTASGDLDENQQAAVLEQPRFITGVYDVWRQWAQDRKTCIYALNITHGEAIRDVFRAAGVRCWIIHSRMKIHDVRRAIREFTVENGVMINIGILTIGSDIPSISAIILARRTLSTALHFQIVGRGQRIHPGKADCLVLDVAGNWFIHGPDVDNPLSVTMEDSEPSERPLKICPMCETGTSVQTKTCPSCGFLFPMAESDPDAPDQTKIKDAGDPGKLVEAVPFKIEIADQATYRYHLARNKTVPTVEAAYKIPGRGWVRQWLCPQHASFAAKLAKWHWTRLGGKYPIPVSVAEWIARAPDELPRRVKIVLDDSGGKYPVIKRVGVV